MNFAKFQRTLFFTEHLRWLLLQVVQATSLKRLSMFLYCKLSFEKHFNYIVCNVNKSTGPFLSRTSLETTSLVTIYKSFLTPYLDYGDLIYDQVFNKLIQRLKSIQCNAALTIQGAKRGSFTEKLYQELGLESLNQKHLFSIFINRIKQIRFNNT